MTQVFFTALRVSAVTLVLTGVLYPFAVTGIARVLFPYEAEGSLLTDPQGRVIGSELIGQQFSSPAYFWPRPSGAGAQGYDGAASSGSNLGPTSRKLHDRVTADIVRLTQTNPDASAPIPADLVTASGSGLDPHLSPDAAMWQVARVARARGVATDRIRAVAEAHIQRRTFGILGMPRVNVLLLNVALDRQFGKPLGLSGAPDK